MSGGVMERKYLAVVVRLDPHKPGRIINRTAVVVDQEFEGQGLLTKWAGIEKGYWTARLFEVTSNDVGLIDHLCSHARVHTDLYPLVDEASLIEPWVAEIREGLPTPPPEVIPPQPEVDEAFAFAEVFARVKEEAEKEAREALPNREECDTHPWVRGDEPIARIQLHERLPGVFLVPPAPMVSASKLRMDFPDAEKVTLGKGVIVAVLDTGYKPHECFRGSLVSDVIDCTGLSYSDPDENGHGTFCASQIASRLPSSEPFGTAREVRIVPIRVLHARDGYGADSWIARGVRTAIKVGARVLSLSLGGDSPMPLTHAAIKEAVEVGCVVVVAAGNAGPGRPNVSFPAQYQECIAVGATDDEGRPAPYSQRGPGLTVWACGTAQIGATVGNTYGRWSGTSMACPHVAAAAAMYLSRGYEVSGQWPVANDVRGTLWVTDAALPGQTDPDTRGILQAGLMMKAIKPKPTDPPKPPADEPDVILIDVHPTPESLIAAVVSFAGWLAVGDPGTVITFQKKGGDHPPDGPAAKFANLVSLYDYVYPPKPPKPSQN